MTAGDAGDVGDITAVSLIALREELLEAARRAPARRAAATVHGDRDARLRQTLVVLLAGVELGEHDSPPEATLQVLMGRARLIGRGREWELGAGELAPIPPERHSLAALEDSAVLLTVLRG